MKKAYILIKFMLITCILTSCNNVNHIEIDEIAHIDVFENYEDNVKLCKDMINQNWDEYLAKEIKEFSPGDTKDLKFFANTRPQENKLIIQFRYPKFDKPKNLEKIRKIIVNQIEDGKKLQKKNEKLILESTKKVENLIEMLNEEKYSEFYNNFHSKLSDQFTYEQFLSFIKQIKDLGFKNSQREYFNKALIKFNEYPTKLTDIIEYRYWQKDNHSQYESFNFQNIEGKMELVGYQVY